MSGSNDLRNRAYQLRDRMPPRRATAPPQENGRRLPTLDRSETEQIRINWSEYEGKPFLSIRMWKRGDYGQFWPAPKRGISIRVRELPDLADGVGAAMDLAAPHPSGVGPSLQRSPQARQAPQPAGWENCARGETATPEGFSPPGTEMTSTNSADDNPGSERP